MNSLLFLAGSIVFASWLTLSFKVIERFGVNTLQAIVFNYITCVITGSVFHGSFPVFSAYHEEWFPWAVCMGLIFIALFNIVAFVAQKIGVAVASVAYKLSLVIPFLFSVYYYNDAITGLKITGVVLALAAVVLTSWPKKDNQSTTGKPAAALLWAMPLILFFGSGFLDTMIKYVEHAFLQEGNQNIYLITAFSSAAVAGIVVLLVLFIKGRQTFSARAFLAGIAIGIPNYFSIWCLMSALKEYADNSSAIIPINNMGIVLFSSIVAWLFLKEKLSVINWLGILLSIGAIAFIAYG